MSVIGSLRRARKGNRVAPPRLEVLEDRTAPATGIGTVSVLNNSWAIRDRASAGPADATFRFGSPGTVPVVGDWNGDGKDDIGTFNPLTATWSLKYGASAGNPDAGVFAFGSPGTVPLV